MSRVLRLPSGDVLPLGQPSTPHKPACGSHAARDLAQTSVLTTPRRTEVCALSDHRFHANPTSSQVQQRS